MAAVAGPAAALRAVALSQGGRMSGDAVAAGFLQGGGAAGESCSGLVASSFRGSTPLFGDLSCDVEGRDGGARAAAHHPAVASWLRKRSAQYSVSWQRGQRLGTVRWEQGRGGLGASGEGGVVEGGKYYPGVGAPGTPIYASAMLTEQRIASPVLEERKAGLPMLDREPQVGDDVRRESMWPPMKTEKDILLANYVPVYVMLPLDAVKRENVLSYPELLLCNLRALKAAGVDGVMVDVWWGIVEAKGPKEYDWSAYEQLFRQIQTVGLKVQVVMSFHQCGGNTGDSCYIPLPAWILEAGQECPDIFFTNQDGQRNQEYLSFGIDEEPVLKGRTGVQVYYDFMKSFRDNMAEFLDSGLVSEVEVGLGPAGELRYPSYPETHGWQFPGIGEFQCYDNFLLAQLRDAAHSIGQYEWGYRGPHDAGRYNDWPHSTGFFGQHGGFATDYGRFFLEWYSSTLLKHGDRVLEAAADVFAGRPTKLAAKVAGIHWWYNSKNHAAELAAGYYNLRERDGYRPIAKMLSRHFATLNFTCAEMRNDEQYWEARCGPEGLVQQVLNAGWQEGLEVACENALPRYDVAAFDQIVANARPDGICREGAPKRRISAFTFLRLCPDLLQDRNWSEFVRFVRAMHAGLDYHPEPEQYFRPRSNVRRSKPVQSLAPDAPRMPVATIPLNPSAIPLAPEPDSEPFFSPDAPGGGLGVQVGEIAAPPGSNFSSSMPAMPKGGVGAFAERPVERAEEGLSVRESGDGHGTQGTEQYPPDAGLASAGVEGDMVSEKVLAGLGEARDTVSDESQFKAEAAAALVVQPAESNGKEREEAGRHMSSGDNSHERSHSGEEGTARDLQRRHGLLDSVLGILTSAIWK